LVAASIFLIICIASLALGLSRPLAGRRHALLTFAWLCAAITTTLVIFSFFPQSQANGSVLGISLGGAGAFVVMILLVSVHTQKQLSALDDAELAVKERDDRIAALADELEMLRQHHAPHPLEDKRVYYYDVNSKSGERIGIGIGIGIVTGDLRNVDFVDIWVNSENVDMQMSRFHEKSVSGLIRYEGADRDHAGRVTNDRVADELTRKVLGQTPVTAGTAIATSAGNLTETNRVRHIIHSAAVQGEPGTGYRQVRGLERCVREVLRVAEQLGDDQQPRSIIFPLLGTGAGGAEPGATARTLIGAVIDYLRTRQERRIRTVFFLAYTDRELSACQDALRALGLSQSRKT
jgi:O-acetyl-ADP-ribose deacetylase (regulator of RNase III)